MSNIYIQEPPTNGKVLLKTTAGDIDIELWSKEAPLASKNFIQLCLEEYYNGTIFHRVVKDFIVQGGDPTGTGTGGESIYGEPFKDEIHSRLRFNRRGLVAMANAGKHDNGSQFFFTLAATPELQKKHTIFGKVAGKTIYNLAKFEEGEIGEDDRPEFPHKIISTEILNNPFPDIVPREKCIEDKKESKKKKTIEGVKNYKLLSFGEEAEDDDEEIEVVNKKFVGKTKYVPGLVEAEEAVTDKRKLDTDSSEEESVKSPKIPKQDNTSPEITTAEMIRNKLNPSGKKHDRYSHLEETKPKNKKTDEEIEKPTSKKNNQLISEYEKEKDKYTSMKNLMPKKGRGREEQTLELLKKFRQKLNKAKSQTDEDEEEVKEEEWMRHALKCEDEVKTVAKDANVQSDDWFEITDPRNPMNKRRREKGKLPKSRVKGDL